MPSFREKIVARLTRAYPLLSGRGSLANSKLLSVLVGKASNEWTWAASPGGPLWVRTDDYVGRAVYYCGDLDPKITEICRKILRKGDLALDVGANIGLVTLLMARIVGPTGRIMAFEPNPEMQAAIRATLANSGIQNTDLYCYALGAEAGVLELMIEGGNAGASSLLDFKKQNIVERIAVRVERLDETLHAQRIDAIRLMKIDVEGFEAQVLLGSNNFLSERRADAILFELNSRSASLVCDEPSVYILSQAGYGIFLIRKSYWTLFIEKVDLDSQTELAGHDLIAIPLDRRAEQLLPCLGIR